MNQDKDDLKRKMNNLTAEYENQIVLFRQELSIKAEEICHLKDQKEMLVH